MERLKSNKYAMMLFISSIAFAVIFVIALIFIFALLDSSLIQAKELLVEQGYDQQTINTTLAILKASIIMVAILGSILLFFVVLCGLKASLKGQWVKGAFVFGIIYVVFEGIDVFDNLEKKPVDVSSLVFNFLYLIISIFYLIGAANLRKNPIDYPLPSSLDGKEFDDDVRID